MTMRAIVYAVVMTLLLAESARAEWGTVFDPTPLRSGPGTNYKKIATIPEEAELDFSKCKDGWCRVKWKDKIGYVERSDLYDEDEAFECNFMGFS